MATEELPVCEQLPPAAELATALSVNCNTVLTAYRQPREDGVLEFRRGRDARVASAGPALSSVTNTTQRPIATAREHGLATNDLIRIIKELS